LKRLVIGLLTIAVVATACGDSTDGPGTTNAPGDTVTTTNPPRDSLEPAPVDSTVPGSKRETPELLPGLPSAVAATDLAVRLKVDVAKITVNVVESVTWPDGSIGCPQPGMSYTQALVPGLRVILEHDGRLYYYHGTSPDALSYCENPSEPIAGDPGDA